MALAGAMDGSKKPWTVEETKRLFQAFHEQSLNAASFDRSHVDCVHHYFNVMSMIFVEYGNSPLHRIEGVARRFHESYKAPRGTKPVTVEQTEEILKRVFIDRRGSNGDWEGSAGEEWGMHLKLVLEWICKGHECSIGDLTAAAIAEFHRNEEDKKNT